MEKYFLAFEQEKMLFEEKDRKMFSMVPYHKKHGNKGVICEDTLKNIIQHEVNEAGKDFLNEYKEKDDEAKKLKIISKLLKEEVIELINQSKKVGNTK
jgi:predicted transcriptional regulator